MFLLSICPFLLLPSCSTSKQIIAKCVHNIEYHNCNTLITTEVFEDNGFHLGDSLNTWFDDIDVSFKNYYKGFYGNNNDPLLIQQASYLYFYFKNSSYDIWTDYDLGEDTSITIWMRKRRKYIVYQNLLNFSYSLERIS